MSDFQFSIPLLIAAQAAAALALVGFTRRGVPGALPFAALMSVGAWSAVAVALGFLADSAEAKFIWLRVQYVGAVFMPAAWIALTLQFRGRTSVLSDNFLRLALIEPVLMLALVWTNSVHGLVWGEMALQTQAGLTLLVVEKSFAFWVHHLYALALVASGLVLLGLSLKQRDDGLKLQTAVLIAAGFLIVQAMTATAAGLVPFGLDGLPLATLVGGAGIGAVLFRYPLMGLLPVARDRVMESMTEGAIVVDDNGKVSDINRAAERISGVASSNAVGMELGDLLSQFGDLGSTMALPYVGFAETGGRYYEVRMSRLHQAETNSRGRLVVIRDITEQRQAEDDVQSAMELLQTQFERQTSALTQELQERKIAELALRENEARARQVLDSAYDAFVAMNANGSIVDWNPRAESMFGLTRDQAIGRDFAESLLPNRSREEHRRGLRFYLTSGDWPLLDRPIELQVRHSDGHEFEAEMTMSAGIVEGVRVFNAFIHDITERKQSETALRDSNAQLEQALTDLETAQQAQVEQERLRALGQMASGIAHEFNNALSPIVGFSELLMIRPQLLQDQEKAMKYLEGISTAAKDAATVVSRLREFYRSREQSEEHESINLNALISQTITLTQPKWRNQAQASGVGIIVSTDFNGNPFIDGDASALREVVTNLIFNAVDAMPEGGSVLIHTAVQGGKVVLQVADSGTGMPEEVRRRCLDPFFSTKGEKGTGLGLSLVHGIVQRHGGAMSIDSELGKGTTFTMIFPAGKEPEPTVEVHEQFEDNIRSLKLLAVDDDESVLQVIEAILEADGHSVVTANSAREGLDALGNDSVDVVLTDLAMPMMNGDKFAQIVKRQHPGTPVVMLTGFAETLNDSEFASSVDIVISKPVAPETLRGALDEVLPKAA